MTTSLISSRTDEYIEYEYELRMDKRMLYNTPSLYYYCVHVENEEEGKPKFVQEIYKTHRYSDGLRELRVDKGRIDRKGIITVVFNICL